MSWLTQDLNRECCLTCQHFNVGRRLKSMEQNLFIEYDASIGRCMLFNNFPRTINCKPTTESWCHYCRWVQLPEKD